MISTVSHSQNAFSVITGQIQFVFFVFGEYLFLFFVIRESAEALLLFLPQFMKFFSQISTYYFAEFDLL